MKIGKPKPFFRGVKLDSKKSLACERPVERLSYEGEIAVPLVQHIGAPAVPVVQTGDRVLRGQLIARAEGFVSANVHASVSGVVKAVEDRADGQGGTCAHVVIEQDSAQENAYLPPLVNPSAQEIAARVRDAGIVGMGGAGFPASVKLSPRNSVGILLLNGAECEPYLTCDDRLMREQHEKIVRGAHYLATALGAERILIGIEKNKPEALALFEKTDLEVIALKKRYPMGSEKHTVYCCTGRKIPVGGLPADVGVTVQNVATAFAVCEAVEEGKPLIERIVTVSGEGVETPANILAPVGTPLSVLAERYGVKESAVKIVVGGPMTGAALAGCNGVVTKTTSGLLFLTEKETNRALPTPCINCGKCADACPMNLMPMQIEFYTACGNFEDAEKYGGVKSCIGCGVCSYVCPARRPLTQAIRTAKQALRRKA